MIKHESDHLSTIKIVKASKALGVKTNETKYAEFAIEQKFIGLVWNVKNKTVSLTQKKLQQRKSEVDSFLSQINYKKSEVEKFNGKLSHLTLILPQLKAYLTENFKWAASWKSPGFRKMPPLAREDMLFWRDCLSTLQPTRLIPDYSVKNVGWVGDASSSYGIGILIGKGWAQFKWIPGWADPVGQPKRTIAWAETVAVRLGLLMLFKGHKVAGLSFSCLTDNTTTEGAARNRKSRDFWVNNEWKLIQNLLIQSDCDINLVRVISMDNSADRLSRGLDSSTSLNNSIRINVPPDLSSLISQVIP